ncbi:MAG TPA: D-2-hydroxyacid dehydrogenase family protein [Puia sp.]|nr:D-2-hydroxyacid dehydrogenase family protein [Puia sp.]
MSIKLKAAILDDYQKVSTFFADWSVITDRVELTIFDQHESEETRLIQRLLPFEILCVMRERTPLNRKILSQLTNCKLIVSTGARNASIDLSAAEEFGITVKNTGYLASGAPELTWGLILAIARHIPQELHNIRSGNWQTTVGTDLKGKTIGIIGLGRIGSRIAKYAQAFEMRILAWSPNLTKEKAIEDGAIPVTKDELFKESDFITIHMVLGARSKELIKMDELKLMKSTAFLINTSRGPLIKESDLIEVLSERKIRGAALDVYDAEPLSPDHPFRKLDNVLATPHIGFVTEETYRLFYQDTVRAIESWLAMT